MSRWSLWFQVLGFGILLAVGWGALIVVLGISAGILVPILPERAIWPLAEVAAMAITAPIVFLAIIIAVLGLVWVLWKRVKQRRALVASFLVALTIVSLVFVVATNRRLADNAKSLDSEGQARAAVDSLKGPRPTAQK